MAKKRNVLDKMIMLTEKEKAKFEEEICSFPSISDELLFVESIISDDDSIDLASLTEKEVNTLVAKVYDQSEINNINALKGAYYVLKNNIPLFDSQIGKLNEFLSRIHELRNDLKVMNVRLENLIAKVNDYEVLEKDLLAAKSEGIIDDDLIETIFMVFDMDDKDKNSFLYDVMEFNLDSYKSLGIYGDEEKEKKTNMSFDDLNVLFEKYKYDLLSLDDIYVQALLDEGNLENIEGVFRAISDNDLSFLHEKRKTKLLTQFLLYSNEEIINDVCAKFRDNFVSSSFFTSYLPVFFPSEDKRSKTRRTNRNRLNDDKESSEQTNNKDDLSVVGLNKDFFENIQYMKENFGVSEKILLEKNVRLLTLKHSSLLRHIEELNLYDYDIHNEKFPLSALIASRIMDSTDSFIEIGEEKYIKRYASRLLFNCGDITKRIYAYKKSELQYHSEGRIGMIKTEVVNGGSECELGEVTINTLVPNDVVEILYDNKCKELLDNNSPRTISEKTLRDPVIVGLDEEYKLDNSKYLIDDIIISRRKVLRNYEFLTNNIELLPEDARNKDEILLVSMINNSLLNAEEIEKIENGINKVLTRDGGSHGISKK